MREKLKNIAVKMTPKDNVATAIRQLDRGLEIDDAGDIIILDAEIQAGHKFATRDIRSDEDVVKYGHIIGVASTEIKRGEWVHTHNLDGKRGRGDLSSGSRD